MTDPAQRQQPLDTLTSTEVRGDLKAAVGARKELGPEMEEQVIEAFLQRIQERIDARVSRDLGSHPQGHEKAHHEAKPELVVAPSLALSIPLVAIAGGEAGALGIASVMLVVLIINLTYFLRR
jgi:hypothetical protein